MALDTGRRRCLPVIVKGPIVTDHTALVGNCRPHGRLKHVAAPAIVAEGSMTRRQRAATENCAIVCQRPPTEPTHTGRDNCEGQIPAPARYRGCALEVFAVDSLCQRLCASDRPGHINTKELPRH